MKRRYFLALAPLLLALPACSDSGSSQKAGGAPGGREVTVGVIKMESGTAPVTIVLPGRAVSYRSADIRPQVGGMIKEIAYKEGTPVKQGDLLFKIEDDTYVAAVAEAEAALAKAQASVPSAEANYERYQRLVKSGGATEIALDDAQVALLQAKADVSSTQAALQSAKINLQHTEIRAPFDGIADVSAFSIGNLVTASQSDALTTIRQTDPIYVDLSDSSVNLLRFRTAIESGALSGNVRQAPISLTLENGDKYDQTGTFDVPKSTVSEATGSFTIRASFPNPKRMLVPGMFVRATLEIGEQKGYLIPQRAASRDSEGNLTARFVSKDGKVETRTFNKATASGNSWLVQSQIADGDQLIIDGLQSISDGMTVKTKDVTLDKTGVAHDVEAQGDGAAAKPAK